ncbi:GNAT family N-acetyltransferase [Agromyces soli]|uniref:GNAT family N-acetyltransferase n=1 Tax=Agromyces soli TaxID=659012 RepID=A0ABY4AUU9_9MICO|nr:GNAT family N-acetyltransferase [Agromyces soli]UOE26948.1 GNAT family N-acetyltransferase [Agromyces soli]
MTDDAASSTSAPPSERPALALPFDVEAIERRPIVTERLVIRPLTADDSDDVWEYQRLPEVLRYIPWPERSRDEAHDHTMRRVGSRLLAEDGDNVHFAIVLAGEPSPGAPGRDRVIGDVMVRVASVEHARLELGWVLHPDFQGRGFAAEATAAVLAFGFDTLHAHRVLAELVAANTASAKLCLRLGMRHEATFVEHEYDRDAGAWLDMAFYAILQREHTAARLAG